MIATSAADLHFEVVGINGDWKWRKQIALLQRFYGRNELCHLCGSTPFADLSPQAAWWSTVLKAYHGTRQLHQPLRNFTPSPQRFSFQICFVSKAFHEGR